MALEEQLGKILSKYSSYRKGTVTDLVNVVDDSNLLVRQKGYGDLKKERMYDYQLTYRYNEPKTEFKLYFTSQSLFLYDMIVRSSLYDERDGSYTISPRNVNGAWSTYNELGVGRALNKSKSLRFQNNVVLNHLNSVEMSGTTATGLRVNKANVNSVEDNLTFSYQRGKFTARLNGGFKFQSSRSKSLTNANYDAYDYF